MRKYFAEFIGTFAITLIGCGTLISLNFMIGAMGLMLPYGFSSLAAALAFGGATAVMYYILSDVSDGHFNPAVSLARFIEDGVTGVKKLIFYIFAQLAGAIAAMAIIWFMTKQRMTMAQVGYESLSPLYLGLFQAVVIELILSFLLVFVFLSVRKKEKEENMAKGSSAVIIGTCVFVSYAFGIVATGGGINPARIFGAAVIALGESVTQLPIFFVIPFISAVLAYMCYKYIICGETIKHSIEENISFTDAADHVSGILLEGDDNNEIGDKSDLNDDPVNSSDETKYDDEISGKLESDENTDSDKSDR